MKEIGNWRHICVDAQRMFAEDTPWYVPWMARVLPQLLDVSERHAERTVFTRFIPPKRPDDAPGSWRDYYHKWWMMTGEHLPRELLELSPPLQKLVPPAGIFDKMTYSPWVDGRLFSHLRQKGVDTVVVTGGETDVCVLATVLGAIDLGLQVIVLSDAVCSGADETHDAAVDVLGDRFSAQLKLLKTEEFLATAR
ncbi:isochorismatase family protein [Agrobacterium vitis]|uniref:Isochorismatase family protein n=1 Tax=Agrobacterium vitis TaxID=373 RepID=A0ABD6G5G2_AGRVI|nr:isochorismatase family cysteine hydrolase [Agrobacterium vitis]MUO79737.1 isochorismatase family protein [Agrobacterium vitis]MUO93774.1 isochorismatase family protein [Agrobacterium vitis]MUP03975.1 isochorismatase family protein [Agrobacterium vitis]MVA91968.1 isochorismatase family protein [Agrobacterium vitis]MVB01463.1 isochorismatase family protein [Agrobacterium vitis]